MAESSCRPRLRPPGSAGVGYEHRDQPVRPDKALEPSPRNWGATKQSSLGDKNALIKAIPHGTTATRRRAARPLGRLVASPARDVTEVARTLRHGQQTT